MGATIFTENPLMAKIYTRTGDDGTTSLGTGERVEKSSLRIACYGTVDELNSILGVARATAERGLSAKSEEILARIQNELFHLGCELSMPTSNEEAESLGPRIEERHVDFLESAIDELSATLEPLKNFILPGGTRAAADLHVARCVCRRAERELGSLRKVEFVRDLAGRYLNRLSDLFFVMSRYENAQADRPDVIWDSTS